MTTRREFSLALASGVFSTGCGLMRSSTPKGFFHKGVNFTAERPDRYDSERARRILTGLVDFGVNSVALVPYGWCRKDSPEIRFSGTRSWERDGAIEDLTRLAHACGMKVLLKPQIWVRGGFPGDLAFSASDLDAWFSTYETFLRHYAALAQHTGADLFSTGVEFVRLSRHEQRWRRLNAVARELYGGPLVYSANWGDEFESVRFWDELDYIGLNNYYPLPDDLSAGKVVAKAEKIHERYHRPVIFPEAGFPSVKAPHREPWSSERNREASLTEQARCYEAVFQAFYHQPWFHGVYWWKIGSNGRGGGADNSHTPWNKPAMDVLARWYRGGAR